MTEGWHFCIRTGRAGSGPRQGGVRERETQSKTPHLQEILNRAVSAHFFSPSITPSVCWAYVSTQLRSLPPFPFTSSTLLFIISPPFFFVDTFSRVFLQLYVLQLFSSPLPSSSSGYNLWFSVLHICDHHVQTNSNCWLLVCYICIILKLLK